MALDFTYLGVADFVLLLEVVEVWHGFTGGAKAISLLSNITGDNCKLHSSCVRGYCVQWKGEKCFFFEAGHGNGH